MKKCLLILPRPVFPLVCGYALKNYNLIQILAKKYSLKLVIISDKEIVQEEKDFYDKLSIEYHIHRIPKWKSYLNTLRGLISTKPLQVCYYYDSGLQKLVDQWMEACDIGISALVRTREYLRGFERRSDKYIVFDMVDSIALNYMRSRKKTNSLFWKLLYLIEGKRLLKYEERQVRNSSITYLFNQEETEYWKKYGNVKWLPHGVNENLFTYDKYDPNLKDAVVFIGKMDYQPNVDAAIWYLENIHRKIGEKVPFVIVGAYPTEKIMDYTKKMKNVTVTGFVDDPYVYVASSLAVIAPMQTGGGIQNKVLEGMALGKINIISSLAAAPIVDAENGKHFIVADKPEEYVEWLLKIVKDSKEYEQIGNQAREFIMEHFTWEYYGNAYTSDLPE